ncbi:hypothetical protein CSOJ01_02001 [Colletotrichum sojae]|uniref:Uncharacterized protein n=1 Tax=Colletotrichum sojae TaxID=2175907 RepID=A0A8H6N3I7_9PEZI|nr:hypothetical protein CSOJ01_02001 [Colletotrichum sojae]
MDADRWATRAHHLVQTVAVAAPSPSLLPSSIDLPYLSRLSALLVESPTDEAVSRGQCFLHVSIPDRHAPKLDELEDSLPSQSQACFMLDFTARNRYSTLLCVSACDSLPDPGSAGA